MPVIMGQLGILPRGATRGSVLCCWPCKTFLFHLQMMAINHVRFYGSEGHEGTRK